jgi:hypothetical protein
MVSVSIFSPNQTDSFSASKFPVINPPQLCALDFSAARAHSDPEANIQHPTSWCYNSWTVEKSQTLFKRIHEAVLLRARSSCGPVYADSYLARTLTAGFQKRGK